MSSDSDQRIPGPVSALDPTTASPPVVRNEQDDARSTTGSRLPSLNAWGGFAIITAATSLIGIVEYGVVGSIGWLTGVVFFIATVFVALAIRMRDVATAVISPPLAFFTAAVISAQPWLAGETGNFWLLQGTSLITALAFNAPWVFGATLTALVIALFRYYVMHRNKR